MKLSWVHLFFFLFLMWSFLLFWNKRKCKRLRGVYFKSRFENEAWVPCSRKAKHTPPPPHPTVQKNGPIYVQQSLATIFHVYPVLPTMTVEFCVTPVPNGKKSVYLVFTPADPVGFESRSMHGCLSLSFCVVLSARTLESEECMCAHFQECSHTRKRKKQDKKERIKLVEQQSNRAVDYSGFI
jgi:hypothetical protein